MTHADFTTTKPEDFPDVTGLVVDPSCSGSGIFGRALEDSHNEEEIENVNTERLNKLAGFQFAIMKHALLFPSARKVVYSTCSIHAQENERVVVDLLLDPEVNRRGGSWLTEKLCYRSGTEEVLKKNLSRYQGILKNVRDWQVVVYEQILKKMEGSDFLQHVL